MEILKELPSGIVATFRIVVRTEMDYNNKTSKATIYYYLDEQAFLDGKEAVFGEVIDVPFVEQVDLEKAGVTAKTMAETAIIDMDKKVEVSEISEVIDPK